jgi:hypothetical protein
MGLTPNEFYSVSPVEFELMARGFHRARIYESKLNRNIMYVIAKTAGSKINSPEELWPLDEPQDISEGMDEVLKLFEAERIRQNLKNG